MDALVGLISNIGAILFAMALLAVLEAWIPLRSRDACSRAHLTPNAVLTGITIAMNAVLGGALALALAATQSRDLGLLAWLPLPPVANALVALLVLDFSFYVAHRAMHAAAGLWRFHRVHHSDPAVDVTTTIRQHPGEVLIRYAFTAAFALPLGATPEAFLLYRSATALFGLLEHANLRVPAWFDGVVSLVFTWPTVHKVHHAREATLTDTNFGNLVCWWDRLFGTFTPASAGRRIDYGLDGLDDDATQTTWGLLRLPFRAGAPAHFDRLPRRCAPAPSASIRP